MTEDPAPRSCRTTSTSRLQTEPVVSKAPPPFGPFGPGRSRGWAFYTAVAQTVERRAHNPAVGMRAPPPQQKSPALSHRGPAIPKRAALPHLCWPQRLGKQTLRPAPGSSIYIASHNGSGGLMVISVIPRITPAAGRGGRDDQLGQDAELAARDRSYGGRGARRRGAARLGTPGRPVRRLISDVGIQMSKDRFGASQFLRVALQQIFAGEHSCPARPSLNP